jgi:hypothetical protein
MPSAALREVHGLGKRNLHESKKPLACARGAEDTHCKNGAYYSETACIFINLQRLAPGGLFKLNLAPPEAPLSRDRKERCAELSRRLFNVTLLVPIVDLAWLPLSLAITNAEVPASPACRRAFPCD